MDEISELLFHEYFEKKEMIEKGFAKWRFLAFHGRFIELTIVWLEEYLDRIIVDDKRINEELMVIQ